MRCRLYLVTPPTLDASFDEALKRALGAGDIASLQLRLKDVSDDEI
ncbi:MAG: thiamine phosphate synthase, partial [Micropepsaceae bacterium]